MACQSVSLSLLVLIFVCSHSVALPEAEGVKLPQALMSAELRFSPDGKKLFVTRKYGSTPLITIHDVRPDPTQGRTIYVPLIYPDLYSSDNTSISSRKTGISTELNPDGNILATVSQKTVRLWDISKDGKPGWWPPKPICLDFPGNVISAFTNDGKQLLTASIQRKMGGRAEFPKLETQVWDVSTGKAVGEPVLSTGPDKLYSPTLKCLAPAPDGAFFLTAMGDEQKDAPQVQLWDTKTLKPIGEPIPAAGSVYRIGPDGKNFMAISKSEIALWDVAARKQKCTLPTPEVAKNDPFYFRHSLTRPWFAVHPNGTSVLHRKDNTATLWDLSGEKPVEKVTLKQRGNAYRIALSKNGKWAATACNVEEKVFIWNLETGRAFLTIPNKDEIVAMEFSPDGKLLATADAGDVHLWKLDDKK